MKQAVRIFKALSDVTRIRMIKLLENAQELCVCEIMKAMGISQTRASRNLNILKNAGLVTDRRSRLWVYYSLNRKAAETCCGDVFPVIRKWLKDDPQVLTDRACLKKFQKYLKRKGTNG